MRFAENRSSWPRLAEVCAGSLRFSKVLHEDASRFFGICRFFFFKTIRISTMHVLRMIIAKAEETHGLRINCVLCFSTLIFYNKLEIFCFHWKQCPQMVNTHSQSPTFSRHRSCVLQHLTTMGNPLKFSMFDRIIYRATRFDQILQDSFGSKKVLLSSFRVPKGSDMFLKASKRLLYFSKKLEGPIRVNKGVQGSLKFLQCSTKF